MAEYDVVIIGSGVAGALCAAGLSETGRKILILEAAQNGLGVAQREQFRRVWDAAPSKSWNTPYLRTAGIRYYPSPGPADTKNYFDQPDAIESLLTFKGYYQRLAGGSTWAWRGNTPRMMPGDFQLKSKYFSNVSSGAYDGANVVDWPLSYDDLKPWYLKAEHELGVSGNAEEWESLTPRDGAKYPMPGQPKSYSDQTLITRMGAKTVILDGEKLSVEIITMAQARNTEAYDGRPACEGNHNCIPLCPTGAKYDATVHLKRAVRNGVEIRTGCAVTKLDVSPEGLISRVLYKQWDSESPQKERAVTGTTVILAANPIETPKILLNSGLYAENDPYVGKHLMDHVQGECLALAPEAIFPFRGPQTLCGIDSLRDGKYRSKFASFRLTLGNDGWGRAGNPTSVVEENLNPANASTFIIGKTLRHKTVDKLTRLVRFGFSTEQLPHADNRVELSNKLDDLGIRRPRIHYAVHKYTQEALQQGYRVSKELFAAMGASHVGEDEFPVDDWNTAAHPMGTCRMGRDTSDSVVDKFGRCHNHANLFIVGASVFPTGSATNPVLTLAALTLMAVDEIGKA
ncbi:MAG: GMC family oxidoreductase [Mesorhizobium sp.]|nr:MAG: GMC family oxidoreductase [Mesorhizobium sp.]